MKIGFVLILIALTALCISAMGQENTAKGWWQKSMDLLKQGKYNESLEAANESIKSLTENKIHKFIM